MSVYCKDCKHHRRDDNVEGVKYDRCLSPKFHTMKEDFVRGEERVVNLDGHDFLPFCFYINKTGECEGYEEVTP